MQINSREDYDSESVQSEAEWDHLARRKAYAVGVLAQAWAGIELPRSMIREALQIRKEMIRNGTWKPA
jgi:hypothetical protein